MKKFTQTNLSFLIIILAFASTFKTNPCCLSSPTSYAATNGPVQAVYSTSGTYVATANFFASNSGHVSFFKVSNGTLSNSVSYNAPGGTSGPASVAFSPDGTLVATCQFSNVTLFKVTNGTLTNPVNYSLPSQSSDPIALAFSPTGTHLAVANRQSNDITIFTVSSGTLTGAVSYNLPSGCTLGLTNSDTPSSILAFSTGSSELAVGGQIQIANGYYGMVTTFTITNGVLSNGKAYQLPGTSKRTLSIAYSPTGAYLVALDDVANNMVIFSANGGTLSNGKSYPVPANSYSIGFTRVGSCIALVNNGIVYYGFSNGTPSGGTAFLLPTGSSGASSVAFSPDSTHILTANELSNDVTLFALGCPTTTTSGNPSGTTTSNPTTTSDASSDTLARVWPLMVSLIGLGVINL